MKEIIQQYLQTLEGGDAQQMVALFSSNGVIHSPLYGKLPAADFFERLFADTNRSILTLLNVFVSVDKEGLFTAHFRYDWILKNGSATSFECVDIFHFDEAKKIKELTIIYDTNKIRSQFESSE